MLISGETFARLSEATPPTCRVVGRFRVKGTTATTTVYEVLDADPAESCAPKLRNIPIFERGCALYYGGKFDLARAAFRECADDRPNDSLVQEYLARCEHHQSGGVPADWDGVEELKTK